MKPRAKTALDACLAHAKVIEGLLAGGPSRNPRAAGHSRNGGPSLAPAPRWQPASLRRATSRSLANTVF
ncbi:protein of unknown function [Methylococcus capsulatus]|uniref:Uncharacterized protein n=1 Tax=Methylococcus capsulatus TaxID=414 RepID=A0AA35XZE3_METCP|nr:protein of unknown function [Methylococcus capsulatus]